MITKETRKTVEKLKNFLDQQSRTSDGGLDWGKNQLDRNIKQHGLLFRNCS